jgi:TolB protein
MFMVVLSYLQSKTLAQNITAQVAFEVRSDICLINIDGTDLECLMQTQNALDYNAIWSPDGSMLAYQSLLEPRREDFSTYIYDFQRKTTFQVPWEGYIHAWSPDGTLLLTSWFDDERDTEIYIIRPDGGELQALTDNQVIDSAPAWSPDGNQIAYLTGLPEGTLMIMDADGENPRSLTTELNINREVRPVWSPDSTQIAFVVNGDFIGRDQTSEIYVVNADGTDLRQLTDTGGVNLDPRWSPDGSQLVFWGYALGAFDDVNDMENLLTEVFRINADGSGLVNLTQSIGLDYHPAWSPDGMWIAFASTRIWESDDFRPGLFIMRPDGTDVQMLTNELPFAEGGDSVSSPVWRPLAR